MEYAYLYMRGETIMNIPGVDIDTGLMNVGDDEEIYVIVLETYVEEAIENVEKLLEYRDQDIKNFTIYAHALKSANNNIGALELGEKARLLEMAGKDEDTAYINANVDSFCDEIRKLVDDISACLEG